jgi:hypothetical protein
MKLQYLEHRLMGPPNCKFEYRTTGTTGLGYKVRVAHLVYK